MKDIHAIDRTFYRFTSVIKRTWCWGNTRKICKLRAGANDLKPFSVFSNIPTWPFRRRTDRDCALLLFLNEYGFSGAIIDSFLTNKGIRTTSVVIQMLLKYFAALYTFHGVMAIVSVSLNRLLFSPFENQPSYSHVIIPSSSTSIICTTSIFMQFNLKSVLTR